MIDSEVKRQQIKSMFAKLKMIGATEINITFEGCGDSGSIEGVYILQDKTSISPQINVEYTETSSKYEDGKWIKIDSIVVKPIKEALEMVCYDMLEKTGIDWYNNDGGFGELKVDLESGDVELEVSSRYTEYTTTNFSLDEDLEEI